MSRHKKVITFTQSNDTNSQFVSFVNKHRANDIEQTPYDGFGVNPVFGDLTIVRSACPIVYYQTFEDARSWLWSLCACTPDELNWAMVAVPMANVRTFKMPPLPDGMHR